MKNAFQKSPYTTTAAVFLLILAVGYVFWNWGAITMAFSLLLYCIVAVAIKLDDIAQRLDDLSAQLRRLSGVAPTIVQESQAGPQVYPTANAGNGPDATDKP